MIFSYKDCIQEYSEDFPKHKMISEALDKEVF